MAEGIVLEIATQLSLAGDLPAALESIGAAFTELQGKSSALKESIAGISGEIEGISSAFTKGAGGSSAVSNALTSLIEEAKVVGESIAKSLNSAFSSVVTGGVDVLGRAITDLAVPMNTLRTESGVITNDIAAQWNKAAEAITRVHNLTSAPGIPVAPSNIPQPAAPASPASSIPPIIPQPAQSTSTSSKAPTPASIASNMPSPLPAPGIVSDDDVKNANAMQADLLRKERKAAKDEADRLREESKQLRDELTRSKAQIPAGVANLDPAAIETAAQNAAREKAGRDAVNTRVDEITGKAAAQAEADRLRDEATRAKAQIPAGIANQDSEAIEIAAQNAAREQLGREAVQRRTAQILGREPEGASTLKKAGAGLFTPTLGKLAAGFSIYKSGELAISQNTALLKIAGSLGLSDQIDKDQGFVQPELQQQLLDYVQQIQKGSFQNQADTTKLMALGARRISPPTGEHPKEKDIADWLASTKLMLQFGELSAQSIDGTSVQENMKAAVTVAEQFGAQTADKQKPIINHFYKLAEALDESPTALQGMISKGAGPAFKLGESPEDISTDLAFFGQRLGTATGGTAFENLALAFLHPPEHHSTRMEHEKTVHQMMQKAHASKQPHAMEDLIDQNQSPENQASAMVALGLKDEQGHMTAFAKDANGKYSPKAILAHLYELGKQATTPEQQEELTLQEALAFKVRGDRAAMLANVGDYPAIRAGFEKHIAEQQSMDDSRETFFNSPAGQIKLFVSNLEDVGTTLGRDVLPRLNEFLKWMNDLLGTINGALNSKNPLTQAATSTAGSVVEYGGIAAIGAYLLGKLKGGYNWADKTLRSVGADGAVPGSPLEGTMGPEPPPLRLGEIKPPSAIPPGVAGGAKGLVTGGIAGLIIEIAEQFALIYLNNILGNPRAKESSPTDLIPSSPFSTQWPPAGLNLPRNPGKNDKPNDKINPAPALPPRSDNSEPLKLGQNDPFSLKGLPQLASNDPNFDPGALPPAQEIPGSDEMARQVSQELAKEGQQRTPLVDHTHGGKYDADRLRNGMWWVRTKSTDQPESGADATPFYHGYAGHRHYGGGEGVPTQKEFHHYPDTTTPLSVSPGSIHGSIPTSNSNMAGKPLANWQLDDAKKLIAMGMSPQDAAGAIGNISAESGGNSSIVGDKGTAFGLGQWHPDRQALFKQMYGKDIRDSTHDEQLKFYHDELIARNQMPHGATAADSARSILQHFEIPKDHATGGANDVERGGVAEAVFQKLKDDAAQTQPFARADTDKMMMGRGLPATESYSPAVPLTNFSNEDPNSVPKASQPKMAEAYAPAVPLTSFSNEDPNSVAQFKKGGAIDSDGTKPQQNYLSGVVDAEHHGGTAEQEQIVALRDFYNFTNIQAGIDFRKRFLDLQKHDPKSPYFDLSSVTDREHHGGTGEQEYKVAMKDFYNYTDLHNQITNSVAIHKAMERNKENIAAARVDKDVADWSAKNPAIAWSQSLMGPEHHSRLGLSSMPSPQKVDNNLTSLLDQHIGPDQQFMDWKAKHHAVVWSQSLMGPEHHSGLGISSMPSPQEIDKNLATQLKQRKAASWGNSTLGPEHHSGLSPVPSPEKMTDAKSDNFGRYGYAYPDNTPQINNSHEHHHYIDGEEMTGSIVESLVRNTNTATRGISGFDPLQSSTQPGSVIARG